MEEMMEEMVEMVVEKREEEGWSESCPVLALCENRTRRKRGWPVRSLIPHGAVLSSEVHRRFGCISDT